MSTFPIRDDEYSVEEISYEDMMHALSLQGTNAPQADKGEYSLPPENTQLDVPNNLNARENDLAKRLSDNANQALPDWLINN